MTKLKPMSVRQYWVAYDIGDDRERARVERCISRYGQRLQKSVFHCVLDAERLARLKGELEAIGCRSGAIALAALAEPAEISRMGKGAPMFAEDWAFTYFPGAGDDADAARPAPIQNRPPDVL